MSGCKDLWMDEAECIPEDFAEGKLDRPEAVRALCRLGFDAGEAEVMLDEAVS